MASDQGPTSAADRAGGVAKGLDHGWIGTEHVLLALFDEPSPATEALEAAGVIREQVEEHICAMERHDPRPTRYDPKAGLSPNPAWYKLSGCATGPGPGRGAAAPQAGAL